MRIAVIFVLTALAGIACSTYTRQSPQPSESLPNQETLDYAEFVMTSCFREKAAALDDGISDAATVGAAVARSCRQESVHYMRQHTKGMSSNLRDGFVQQ